MTTPRPTSRPERREDVVFRPLAEQWVLYDPSTRRLHVLNLAAALVWSHCDGTHDVGAMVEAVRGAFDPGPPEPDIRRDVLDALETFAREGLLR